MTLPMAPKQRLLIRLARRLQPPWERKKAARPDGLEHPAPKAIADEPARGDHISKPAKDYRAVATPAREASAATVDICDVIPNSGVFDRTLMLRIWKIQRGEVHDLVHGMRSRKRVPPRGSKLATLEPGQNGYKVVAPKTRAEELERNVRGLLNKISPDNSKTIVERLAQISLDTASELELVINIIFQKALVEPLFIETYVEMVSELSRSRPEFPPENDGDKPLTFARALINVCQNEFDSMVTPLEPTAEERVRVSQEDLEEYENKRKKMALANMKLIGKLFQRSLLKLEVIRRLVTELIGTTGEVELPGEEDWIEWACELLRAIGYTLETSPLGVALMLQFVSRLVDLRERNLSDGRAALSKRTRFLIQDLLDLRANQWQQKDHDVRKDAMKKDDARRRTR